MLEIKTTKISINEFVRIESSEISTGLTERPTIIRLQTKNIPTMARIFLFNRRSVLLEIGSAVNSSKLSLVCLTCNIKKDL